MKTKLYSRRKRSCTKSVLRLPDLEHAKTAVLNSLTCPDAQRGYRHDIDEFVDWCCSEPRLAFNRIVVLRYRSHLESRQLAPGTINLRLGVKESAKTIGITKLAPHDLRRTCARLCHASGGELEQIQFLLGHVSVQTTERYLGCKQRIRSAINDRISIEPNP